MSGQPYSDRAREAYLYELVEHVTGDPLAAMHDREALGLDASVCARSYRDEIIAVVKRYAVWPDEQNAARWVESILRHEFGEQP